LIKTVLVFEQPKANYQVNSIEQCLSSNNFILTDNSTITSGSIDKYLWDFGDAANALTKNTNHNYTSAGTFTVVYQIESDKGCFDTIQFSSNCES
jgi:PKD repeat protein